MTEHADSDQSLLGDNEKLLLHQLRLLEWYEASPRRQQDQKPGSTEEKQPTSIPDKWCLTRDINLYDWQKECLDRWFNLGCKGTVKVVTGGGKTLLALAIAERLQNEKVPGLRLAIVVPTIVLMNQWHDELLENGNLPADAIARLGGDYQEEFGESKRILISVLASACKKLPNLVQKAGVARSLLLIADECHRAGSRDRYRVFKTKRKFNLGLSATPEREEDAEQDDDSGYDESPLGKQLGPIIYDFNLVDALELGIVPPYTISHYGLPLSAKEKSRYDRLSRAISDTESSLRGQAPANKTSGVQFYKWVRTMSTRNKGEIRSSALRLLTDQSRRKMILHTMVSRRNAVQTLLKREFSENPDARIILFHERIDEVMKLFVLLHKAGFRVIAEHSELPGSVREAGLELFRRGIAQIIVSARSLIEGFNVPAVDMAIIVASSTSVRQRVQSLGRVLRKHRGKSGEEKTSKISVLYAKDTVEDGIYRKFDWNLATGIDRNLYFHWDGIGDESPQDGPPRYPLPTEEKVDDDQLREGGEYPGVYEGTEYSCDTMGNIQDMNGGQVRDPGTLPKLIVRIKGSAGRFRVTKKNKYVLVRITYEDEWTTIFVTRLKKDFDVGGNEDPEEIDEGIAGKWAENASPGDDYPYRNVPMIDSNLRFSQKRGGIVVRKIKGGGENYARDTARAKDRKMGVDAEALIDALKKIRCTETKISRLEVNKLNHVLYRSGGRLFFIYALQNGLEFKDGKIAP